MKYAYLNQYETKCCANPEETRERRSNRPCGRAGGLALVAEPAQVFLPVQAHELDAGEAAALMLALAEGGTILTDEHKARVAATKLGIAVLGTLGLLKRARQDEVVPALRPIITRLVRSGYFIAPELVEQLVAQVNECL